MNTFRHYCEILDELIERNEFFQFYFQDPYALYGTVNAADGYYMPPTVELCCGVSRGALISEDCDEIVKFDIEEYSGTCAKEIEIYEDAVGSDVSECFARGYLCGIYEKRIRTWKQYDVCDYVDTMCPEEEFHYACTRYFSEEDKEEILIRIPLYAYEKANSIGYLSNDIEDEEEELASSYTNSPLMERDSYIAASFVHEYGEEKYADLSQFLMEEKVNDIHCGNVGWIGKRFVIIDYAGFD